MRSVLRVCIQQKCHIIRYLASARQNLSSGFPTKQDLNQSSQLQRIVGKMKYACRKFRYDTFQKANNKGADQSARGRRLVCAFVFRMLRRQVFLSLMSYCVQ